MVGVKEGKGGGLLRDTTSPLVVGRGGFVFALFV